MLIRQAHYLKKFFVFSSQITVKTMLRYNWTDRIDHRNDNNWCLLEI